jgi:hypothetical protein
LMIGLVSPEMGVIPRRVQVAPRNNRLVADG